MADEKQVSGEVLVALLREATNAAGKVAEINGSLGDRVKHHVEHSNLDTFVFGIVKRLDRMEELKRDEKIAKLEYYLDVMRTKKWDREGHAGDLAEMAGGTDEDDVRDPDAEATEANEAALRQGISELPEDADDKPKRGERRRVKKPAGGDAPGSYRVN